MNVLLDTHALIWWAEGDPRLSARAAAAIEDSNARVAFSAASVWEMATKIRLGKLRMNRDLGSVVHELIRTFRLEPLAVSVEHGRVAGELPGPHRDPFDRMLIAQARLENLAIVTNDPVFRQYRVKVLW